MTAGINRDSAVPPYRQLAELLRAQIESGELAGRLPTELAMAEQWGVGHGTVRKALGLLRDAGLVATYRGTGSEVIPPQDSPGRG